MNIRRLHEGLTLILGQDPQVAFSSSWNELEADPSARGLDNFLKKVGVSSDIEASVRQTFAELYQGLEPSHQIPFAVRMHGFSDSNPRQMSSLLRDVLNPRPLGDVFTRHSDLFDTNVHFTVTLSTPISSDGQFEDVAPDTKAIVIWFHGSGALTAKGTNFYQEMNGLARYGIASVSMDLPSHAAGPLDDKFKNPVELARWIRKIVLYYAENYPGRPIMLAGHSFGPSAILDYISLYSDDPRVSGAMLVSPGGPFDSKGAKHHLYEYPKFVSDVMREMGGYNRAGSELANALQFQWPYLRDSKNPFEKIPIVGNLFQDADPLARITLPIYIFSGDEDRVYPNMDYLRDLEKRLPNATFVKGTGLGHLVFDIDQNPKVRDRVYGEVFGETNGAAYARNGLRFVSALVLDFLRKNNGFEFLDDNSADAVQRAVRLYEENPDFRAMIDRSLARDVRKDMLEDWKKKLGSRMIDKASNDPALMNTIDALDNEWETLNNKPRKQRIADLVSTVEKLSLRDNQNASDSNQPPVNVKNPKLLESLRDELGQRAFAKWPQEKRQSVLDEISLHANAAVGIADETGTDPKSLETARERINKNRSEQILNPNWVKGRLVEWGTVSRVIALFDGNSAFRERFAAADRSEMLTFISAQEALKRWDDCRAALILYDMNPTFRRVVGGTRDLLVYPTSSAGALKQWEDYCEKTKTQELSDIKKRHPNFYEWLATSENTSGITQNDIDEPVSAGGDNEKKSKGIDRHKSHIKVVGILTALADYLEKNFEQTEIAEGRIINPYALTVKGREGQDIRNTWNHLHTRTGSVASGVYSGDLPSRRWYRKTTDVLDGTSFGRPAVEDYRRGKGLRVKRLAELFNLQGQIGVTADHVLSLGAGGDVVAPFELFKDVTHVTVLTNRPFGPPDFDKTFTPRLISYAHGKSGGKTRALPMDRIFDENAGWVYINNIVAGLTKNMAAADIVAVFYFIIEDGKKVYVEPDEKSPETLRNAEIRFRDNGGKIKTLDVVHADPLKPPPYVTGYLGNANIRAVYVGRSAATEFETAPDALSVLLEATANRGVTWITEGEYDIRAGNHTLKESPPVYLEPKLTREYEAGDQKFYVAGRNGFRSFWRYAETWTGMQEMFTSIKQWAGDVGLSGGMFMGNNTIYHLQQPKSEGEPPQSTGKRDEGSVSAHIYTTADFGAEAFVEDEKTTPSQALLRARREQTAKDSRTTNNGRQTTNVMVHGAGLMRGATLIIP